MRLLLSVTLGLMLLSGPAFAQQQGGYLYSPAGCDFQVSFPAEPRLTKRCHDELPNKCSMMTTYTQVFSLDATVNVYVSCQPTSTNARKDYTSDLLRTSLLARPGVSDLETYDITFSETDKAIMGALLGAGETPNGNDVMIYVAEIWAGDNSVFTLEGELIGKQSEDADKIFGTILRSLHHKGDKPDDEGDAVKDKNGGDKDKGAANTGDASPGKTGKAEEK